MIVGHDKPTEDFLHAWRSGKIHHAWLLAGPRGVGKATFARQAARRVLAEAAGEVSHDAGLDVPDVPTGHFLDAGSHPDFRLLERVENKSGTALARNISVDQVRALAGLFAVTPSLGDWRVVIIDSLDDLEKSAANALLKMLEEPPPNCLFLLVSHNPGRLLPTIRSRCRMLAFQPLDHDAMTSFLDRHLGEGDEAERRNLVEGSAGVPGRALAIQRLDLVTLRDEALTIMREGDPSNARRSALSRQLGGRMSADRYAAFLDLVPSLIAGEVRRLDGAARRRALDAYARARETVALAPRLSFDPAATAFQIGTILASVAPPTQAR